MNEHNDISDHPLRVRVVRLRPGADLRQSLAELVETQAIDSGLVLTCVGSLSQAQLRLAGASEVRAWQGPFEIVSLVGTLARAGLHLHLALADREGSVIGGHLMPGCIVHTTAELAIGICPGLHFARQDDPASGYKELVVTELAPRHCKT